MVLLLPPALLLLPALLSLPVLLFVSRLFNFVSGSSVAPALLSLGSSVAPGSLLLFPALLHVVSALLLFPALLFGFKFF